MTETTLLLNGKIYTGKPGERATALVIRDGRIVFVGNIADACENYGKSATSLDLGGKTVWPGLIDSHLHLYTLSERLAGVECNQASLAECLQQVYQKAKQVNDNSWIIGFNWDQNEWHPAVYGTAAQLDSVSLNHPVLLFAKSLHAVWVNTAVLHHAGITVNSPDPPGGKILRDAQGEPAGILLENAMTLVNKVIPENSPDQLTQKLQKAQKYLISLGIIGVHDFDRWESVDALMRLAGSGKLKLRLWKSLPADSIDTICARNMREELDFPNCMSPGWIKCFADGALGPQSAAMLEPYENSDSGGMLLLNSRDIFQIGSEAAGIGWPIAVHAIGDAAVRETLDGLAALRQYEQEKHLPHLPHRMEHLQLISPQDQRRLHQLDIIASVQPTHATSDMEIAQRHWGSRSLYAYAYNTLEATGAKLIFGSDAPVESPNPFWGLHAAVTRRRADGVPGPQGWHSNERISLQTAFEAYSLNPASISGKAIPTGRLAPGFLADLIVLPEDPFTMNPQDLWSLKPEMTMISGKVEFSN